MKMQTAGVLAYDPAALDQWLLQTEGGPAQITDRPLLGKKARTAQEISPGNVRTRKIRVYPANEQQRVLLLQWFGTARWTYNECLKRLQLQDSPFKPTRSGGLREAVVNDGNYGTENTWVLNTPRDIRAGAYQDLLSAYDTNFKKKRRDPTHHFEIRFRSRKSPQERIYIGKRNYNKGVIYPTKFGKVPLRATEPLPARLARDAHLIRTRLGHYYLCITQDLRTIPVARDENQVPRIAAIDPGVRTPHMLYDPAGRVTAFGTGDMGRLYRLCYHLDRLRSKIDLLPRQHASLADKKRVHRRRWRMRKAWRRASLRVRHLVDEYHRQVVHTLVTKYDVVLLPALETSRLILRKTCKLTSATVRAMVTWAHYRFRQRLLWKAQTTGTCQVVVCGEAYTSKTCGACGWINEKLGGDKVFACRACGVQVNRDVNGARNILLKNASRFGFQVDAALGLTPTALRGAVHGPRGRQASTMK